MSFTKNNQKVAKIPFYIWVYLLSRFDIFHDFSYMNRASRES